MLKIVSYIFYLIGIIDFCGMFFEYDFTGVSWSPIAFAAVGAIIESLGKKSQGENDTDSENN